MQSANTLNFSRIISLLRRHELSCEELSRSVLDNINTLNPVLNCFISLENEEKILKQARESDRRRLNNKELSLIDGIPIAVKDNIHSIGLPTTCASRILGSYYPPFDAEAAARIKAKGGIIIGKTNMDEFAMGSANENSAFGPAKNPRDTSCSPGGSSGGSAAAVAAGMAPLALGSDTGGSVRQPASFCGITGMKPTYGLVSRYGLVSYASSLDQIGTFSNDVYGNAVLLQIISGRDSKDSTSLESDMILTEYHKCNTALKAAYFPEMLQGIDPDISENFYASLEMLRSAGIEITEISFPPLAYSVAAYYFIACAEASSNLSRYDGVKYGIRPERARNYRDMIVSTRTNGFGAEVKKRLLLGTFVLSSGYYDQYYIKAQKVRALITEELNKILTDYDIIASPSTPFTAFRSGTNDDPINIYKSDITNILPNLSGLPAISVPSGSVRGMPAGLQLAGKRLGELTLLRAAHLFEKYSPGTMPPLSGLSLKEDM